MLKHILLVSTILGATLATPVAEPESATDLEKRCTPPGQFCNRGVPCCSGAWCGNNGLCSRCIPRGQFCNRGVPCCAAEPGAATTGSAPGVSRAANSVTAACRAVPVRDRVGGIIS
ncbi:hypothetical protein ACQRIU_005379 [Beauveria bassiana]